MQIVPLLPDLYPAAAALFVQQFAALRQSIPVLPATLQDVECISEQLGWLSHGVAALDGDRVVGYLGAFMVKDFRGTGRKAAYVPEWGHAALSDSATPIYRALYRAAGMRWSEQGCTTHAITLLANDAAAEKAWFWNGFGLHVVDAVRPMTLLGAAAPQGFQVRAATLADVDALAEIEAEHWQHYSHAPMWMLLHENDDAAGFTRLLSNPINAVWVGECDGELMGYMRFEGRSEGAVAVVEAETSVAITGAYTRAAYRGRGLAPALLDAALADYARRGYTCCSVDFEAFNPEAAAFWTKHFQPVCLSVVRAPEALNFGLG